MDRTAAMDWVILAGTIGHESGWTGGVPRPLLPLPGTTLLENLLSTRARFSNGSCTICANGHIDALVGRVQGKDGFARGVGFLEDGLPVGPAGCLKACEPRLTGATILVVNGSTWFEDDPDWMLDRHRQAGNALTVFCKPDRGLAGSRSALLSPAGIYLCEPTVLDCIGPNGYRDIKEELIPALQRAGLRVGAVPLSKPSREVVDWPSYLSVVDRVLSTGRFPTQGYRNIAPHIWCGEGVELSPNSRIVGPALLGHHSRIEDDAVLIGPTTLGADCHIGRGSWLVRVVGGDRLSCPAGSSFADRFLPEFSLPPSGARTAVPGVIADRRM